MWSEHSWWCGCPCWNLPLLESLSMKAWGQVPPSRWMGKDGWHGEQGMAPGPQLTWAQHAPWAVLLARQDVSLPLPPAAWSSRLVQLTSLASLFFFVCLFCKRKPTFLYLLCINAAICRGQETHLFHPKSSGVSPGIIYCGDVWWKTQVTPLASECRGYFHLIAQGYWELS